jgi:hypothetical protein
MPDRAGIIIAVTLLTVLAGFADAQGFLHASRIWDSGRLDLGEVLKSGLAFAFAIAMYWGAVWYFRALGVASAEVQAVCWFAITMVGVAALSGKLFQWRPIDQVVALAVLSGIGFLIVRTGE